MADRRVRYILEVDYDGRSVVVSAADDLREVDDAAREAGDGLRETGDGFSKLQANIVTAQSALGLVQQGFDIVRGAAQGVWSMLEEGAALQDSKEDFDALATSIGAAGSAMLVDMTEAAGGMLTNAEMIAGASGLIQLNLGLSKQSIVDLVGVAGELEWSLEAVTTVINTQSTRGLKELGLGVDDVQGRIEELTDEGHSLEEAFTLALLDAGRERIALVGGASDTAAGKMVAATNAVSGYTDALKVQAVQLLDNIGLFDSLAQSAEGLNSFVSASDAIDEAFQRGRITSDERNQLELISRRGGVEYQRAIVEELNALRDEEVRALQWAIDAYNAYYAAQEPPPQQYQGEFAAVQAQEYAENQEWLARATGWMADEQRRAAAADYERAGAVGEMNQELANQAAAMDLAAQSAEAWTGYVAEATARGGDYFSQITSSGRAQFDLNEALYTAADAAGAGAGALADIGVEVGLISEATAQTGVAAAQSQAVADSLAGAAAAGKVSWEEYVTTVERALRVLRGEEYLIDLGPREAPEVEDRGFREGLQEDFEADTRDMPSYTVVLEADNQAVLAAVEEARGMVEGFATPADVYEAVLDMDITAVQEKGETVRAIIDDLPARKTVVIDVEIGNAELLEQLRAMGALP